MQPRVRTQSIGRPIAKSRGRGTGKQVGRGGRGRGPRGGNDKCVDELNGLGNNQAEGANRNVEGANGGVERALDFLTIIAQQLQKPHTRHFSSGKALMWWNSQICMLSREVGRGGRGRGPRGGNDECVDELNGLGNNQAEGANRNVEGANGGVEGALDFLTIIAQQLQNLIPVILAQVGCSYKEFLACNPKEYDGKGGVVVLTRCIEKMDFVQDMSGCSKYTAGLFIKFCPSHEMQKWETELWNHVMVGAVHAAYTNKFYEVARLVPHLVTLESRKIDRNGSIKKVKKIGNVGEPSKDWNGRDDNKRTRTGNDFVTTANPVRRENTSAGPKCTSCNSYHALRGPCRTCFNCNRQSHFTRIVELVVETKWGRVFMLRAEETCQDSNIVMGIEPNELGFKYEIEIASGQLV
nr:hypothetical protein [Tanacetum cinerariifolium]